MSELQKYNDKQWKPDTEEYMLYDCIYITFQSRQN